MTDVTLATEARAGDDLIRAALSEVYDPEIGIDIVSLGLIYGTNIDDEGLLTIDMTLTTPYCPLGPVIETQAHAVCAPLPGVRDVKVNLVWSPPWDPRTMASDEAKLELGRKMLESQIQKESDCYYATARLWDDGIIDPRDTRTVVAIALSAAYNAPVKGTMEWGVFRH